jgi:exosortase/archaeosortase family protein
MDGCRIGVEGKMINVLEGCNGIKLAFVYIAYLVGVNENTRSTIIQSIVGLMLIQLFNVFRIGMLVMLMYHGGEVYFFFIKYIFGVFIYGSIIVLWLIKPLIDKSLQRYVQT